MIWGIGIVTAALVAALGWRWLIRYFVRAYYRQTYAPLSLNEQDIVEPFPLEHHLTDTPWISSSLPLCQSISLQMIAAQQGVVRPRRYFDFLMGFTYGASDLPGTGFMPFGIDPEIGMMRAAPYLGLLRRYYVTNDGDLFRRALREYLSRGYAVRLALDMGALYGRRDFAAHSKVLVGYDAGGFYYYETVCRPPAVCQTDERPAGERGLYVPDALLLEAVLSHSRRLSYPWRYALTIFWSGTKHSDLTPVWRQNAEAIENGSRYGPKMGIANLLALARRIERQGVRFEATRILRALELGAVTRRDNAILLREMFAGESDLTRAAALLDCAADNFQVAGTALSARLADQAQAERVAGWLRDAAEAERKVGRIFWQRSVWSESGREQP
jgi:hypothetical protein